MTKPNGTAQLFRENAGMDPRFDWKLHAADWSPEQVAEWKRAYLADEPIIWPYPEHEEDECGHCDLLRTWMREVDAEDPDA